MEFSSDPIGHQQDIIDLFTNAFTASEGAAEGARVGRLAGKLLKAMPSSDITCFLALENEDLVGCIFLSKMFFPKDDRVIYILSPVAVAPNQQRTGIGQMLITYGLALLQMDGAEVALTYGDPDYYSKVGFQQIDTEFAQPPFKLSHPQGWQAQNLAEGTLAALKGPSGCVAPLFDPALW